MIHRIFVTDEMVTKLVIIDDVLTS